LARETGPDFEEEFEGELWGDWEKLNPLKAAEERELRALIRTAVKMPVLSKSLKSSACPMRSEPQPGAFYHSLHRGQ
jgi:hypothetical protein